MTTEQIIATIIFIITYLFIVLFHNLKSFIIWGGILLLFISGIVKIARIPLYIDWNVMGIFWGTLVVAELFIKSKMPARLAYIFLKRGGSVVYSIIVLSALSGIVSAFVENVATVMIIAPIAFEIARRLKISPVPYIITIALSSNLQGSATLVGDPPSMILASEMHMNFNDFFFYKGKPSLFFAVELGAFVSLFVIYIIYRNKKEKIEKPEPQDVKSYFPTVLLILMILLLAIGNFLPFKFDFYIGTVCVLTGVIGWFWSIFRKDIEDFSLLRDTDWHTFFFLMGVFVMVGAMEDVKIFELLAHTIGNLVTGGVLFAFILLIVVSVIVSAFVDNIPYFTAMVKVIKIMAFKFNLPITPLMFGTVLGSTIGGNITPIGASANIVGTGFLKKKGYKVNFWNFVKVGFIFTVSSLTVSALFVWIFFRKG